MIDKKLFSVLVIDDDPIVRDVLSEFLKKEGYNVSFATDGNSGLNSLLVKEYDVVVTDLRMPGIDGIEVLKNAIRLYPEISVIILTAFSSLETAVEATRLGAFGYLTKPFYPVQISHILEIACQKKILLNENKLLRNLLRETYTDLELLEKIDRSGNIELASRWFDRLNRLKSLNVIESQEAENVKIKLLGR